MNLNLINKWTFEVVLRRQHPYTFMSLFYLASSVKKLHSLSLYYTWYREFNNTKAFWDFWANSQFFLLYIILCAILVFHFKASILFIVYNAQKCDGRWLFPSLILQHEFERWILHHQKNETQIKETSLSQAIGDLAEH
jgi:hypothetical protein